MNEIFDTNGGPGSASEDRLRLNIPVLRQHLQFSEEMFMRALDDLRAWDEILGYLERAVDGIEEFLDSLELPERVLLYLQQYKATTQELARLRLGASLAFSTSVAAPTTIFAGVVCFMSGLLCFVKDSQPTSIWATSFAVVGGVLSLFVALVAHVYRTG